MFLTAGFVVLLVLRVGYGYFRHPDEPRSMGAVEEFEWGSRNYASTKFEKGGSGRDALSPPEGGIDQKYERIAELAVGTHSFADDHARVRAAIESHQALVQFERSGGLERARSVHLAIGVDPERFDQLVAELQAIGSVERIQVHKVDKTNDYRQLQANRLALEKARTSLIALQGKGGSIEELVRLEEKILATEREIQELGVQLGEFDEENEMCTVKLTLTERVPATAAPIPFAHRLKVAFEWTVVHYCYLLICGLVGLVALFFLLLVIEKTRAITAVVKRLQTSDGSAPETECIGV